MGSPHAKRHTMFRAPWITQVAVAGSLAALLVVSFCFFKDSRVEEVVESEDPVPNLVVEVVRGGSCEEKGFECGKLELEDGQVVTCGSCSFPSTCGGGGGENRCGCKPLDCSQFKRSCGQIPDGCGGVLLCGPPCKPKEVVGGKEAAPLAPAWPLRIGYMAHWGQFNKGPRRFTPENIQGKYFTHLAYTYPLMDESYQITHSLDNELDIVKEGFTQPGMWSLFATACRSQGVVPMVGLGGGDWTYNRKGKEVFAKLLDSPRDHKKFARKVAAWLREYRFLGVVIDAELMSGGKEHDWVALLKEVRKALNKMTSETGERTWLSMDAPGWVAGNFRDKAALGEVLDFLTIKAFHQRRLAGPGSGELDAASGPHVALFEPALQLSVDALVSAWLSGGFPAGKLSLGVSCQASVFELEEEENPGYGRPLEKDENGKVKEATLLPLGDLPSEFLTAGGHLGLFHVPSATAFGYSGRKLVSYESPQSMAVKMDYVLQRGLAGTCLIFMDMDNEHVLAKAISEKLEVTYPSIITRSEKGGVRMIVTSSYPRACKSQGADHLLARSFKNKVDYARMHGMAVYENRSILDKFFGGMWSKQPLLRSLMTSHPEVEWFWWIDGDAFFTDMKFEVPWATYADYNLVVPGRSSCVFDETTEGGPNWVCLNAGVFLIRNCKWSLDFIDEWLKFGDPSKAKENERLLSKTLSGRNGIPSDDQSALHYLILTEGVRFTPKVYLEDAYNLHGFWKFYVERLDEFVEAAGPEYAWHSRHWPNFVTHFVGCKMCSQSGSGTYDQGECFQQMERVLNFADNLVLLPYGLQHANLSSPELVPYSSSPAAKEDTD